MPPMSTTVGLFGSTASTIMPSMRAPLVLRPMSTESAANAGTARSPGHAMHPTAHRLRMLTHRRGRWAARLQERDPFGHAHDDRSRDLVVPSLALIVERDPDEAEADHDEREEAAQGPHDRRRPVERPSV